MEPGDSFFALRNFAKGKIDRFQLEESDPLIYDVRPRENLGQSIVELRFKDEDTFLRYLNLSEDDAWFVRMMSSTYNDYEFFDSYSIREDFQMGYGPWYYFNDENKELLEKISKFIYPKNFDIDDKEQREEYAEKLYNLFQKEIDEIIYDYTYERNRELRITLENVIQKDFDDVFDRLGFDLVSYEGIRTTVADLIALFVQHNIPHVSLKKLIETIFQDNDIDLGGWHENYYEYSDDDNFDKDSFNKTANRELEKIYEKLVEKYDNSEGQKYLQMIDRVSEKYNLDRWTKLPKDKRFEFKIDGFNDEGYRIIITLRKPTGETKKLNLTEENFNYLLYQPELFNLEDI